MRIKLKKTESIIAVTPEYASGPGWANALLHVHIVDFTNKAYRVEYYDRDECTKEQQALFRTLEAAHSTMLGTIIAVKEKTRT